jgi:hypothetical protein
MTLWYKGASFAPDLKYGDEVRICQHELGCSGVTVYNFRTEKRISLCILAEDFFDYFTANPEVLDDKLIPYKSYKDKLKGWICPSCDKEVDFDESFCYRCHRVLDWEV